MKETFFRTLSWLHTWAGLLVCWVLLLIFFAGSLSYFRHEISLWNQPELHKGVYQGYQADALEEQLDRGQRYIETHSPAAAQRWIINFPTERKPVLGFSWQLPPEKGQRRGKTEEHIALADDSGIISTVRGTRGGDFFYRLHFDLHYMSAITARYIVGVCTMFMLIALISGIVIHKRIFKDLFSFRRDKGARSWLDAHNVSSVIALPYHLMITYTGLITLMLIYIPWTVDSAYSGDNQAFLKELNPARQTEKAAGINAPQVQLSQLLPQVKAAWGNAPIKQVVVSSPQDQNSQVTFYQNTGKTVTDEANVLIFNGVNGELKYASPSHASGALATYDAMMSLHTARFAAPLLRILFFFCGLLGCAMVATGTLMWAVRLRQKQQKEMNKGEKTSFGLRLVEGLNFMFIIGLPLGAVAFFYANRLIPTSLVTRSEWEVHCFFIALAAMGIWAIFGRSRRQWQTALILTGSLCCALPLLNAFTSPSHFIDNIQSHQWALVGFDSFSILLGCAMLFASKKLTLIAKAPIKRPATLAPTAANARADKARRGEPNATLTTELTSPSMEEAKS